MEQLKKFINEDLVGFCIRLVVTLVILAVGFLLVKLIMKLLRRGRLTKKMDPSVKGFLDSAIGIILRILVIVTAVTYAGVPMASIITVLGSLGVAIGLALQGGLSNVAGGVLILVNRPFRVGDYIKVGEHDGVVENIGIYYTTIKTFDGKKVVIPNGTVTSSVVVNNFTEETRRVDLTFSAAYSSDIDLVKRTLLDVANANPRVLKDPAARAVMTEQADSALKFALRVWVKIPDYWEVQFELTEDVKRAFDAAGIEIPFPQIDVHSK